MRHGTTNLYSYECDQPLTSEAVEIVRQHDVATVTLDMSEVIEARHYREDEIVWYRMRRAHDMSRIKGRDAARMYRDFRDFHGIVG
jgi:hypothetical protein